MGWLRPPPEDDPAGGLLMAAVLWLQDIRLWWCGLLVAAGVTGERRVTVMTFGVVTVVAVVVSLIVEGPGLAITMAVLMLLGLGLGLWVMRRWTRL